MLTRSNFHVTVCFLQCPCSASRFAFSLDNGAPGSACGPRCSVRVWRRITSAVGIYHVGIGPFASPGANLTSGKVLRSVRVRGGRRVRRRRSRRKVRRLQPGERLHRLRRPRRPSVSSNNGARAAVAITSAFPAPGRRGRRAFGSALRGASSPNAIVVSLQSVVRLLVCDRSVPAHPGRHVRDGLQCHRKLWQRRAVHRDCAATNRPESDPVRY
jgi:hypothetical protein